MSGEFLSKHSTVEIFSRSGFYGSGSEPRDITGIFVNLITCRLVRIGTVWTVFLDLECDIHVLSDYMTGSIILD